MSNYDPYNYAERNAFYEAYGRGIDDALSGKSNDSTGGFAGAYDLGFKSVQKLPTIKIESQQEKIFRILEKIR